MFRIIAKVNRRTIFHAGDLNLRNLRFPFLRVNELKKKEKMEQMKEKFRESVKVEGRRKNVGKSFDARRNFSWKMWREKF